MKKNDITYEYRVFTNRCIDIEPMEVGICTSKVIKELKPNDKVDGRFFHTSDSDEWFFCWDGKLQKLNLKGNSDVTAALDEVEKLIANANIVVNEAKATANEAKNAAIDAKTAADAAAAAVENIDNKADKSVVEAVAKAVDTKADASVVEELSAKVDSIKIPSMDNVVEKDDLNEYAKLTDVPSLDGYATETYVSENYGDKRTVLVMKDIQDMLVNLCSDWSKNENYEGSILNKIKVACDKVSADVEENYAKKSELPTVPENVSAFTNDVGYLTEHQDITGKQDVIDDLADIRSNAALGATALQEVPDGYVTEDVLSTKGYLTNDSLKDYATEEYVDGEIKKIEIPTKVSAFENDVNYLTEHQSLDNYFTKAEVNKMIEDINALIGEAIDKTNTILA